MRACAAALVCPRTLALLLVLGLLVPARVAMAQALISRTITINGVMSDWTTAPSVTSNAGQFSTDCSEGQTCETDDVQSTGRDLKKFAYTWDNTYLYFYVERYASSSNTTEWLFYLDEDVDGKMETGERIFRVDWQGSNQTTNASLCVYTQAVAGGDPIGGDGQTLPGSGGSCTAIYSNVVGGTTSGVEMESRLAWSSIGASGPRNTAFHISSSRGMNLPSQVEDNMGGPGGSGSGGGGGQLFPPDLAVAIGSTETQVNNQELFTLTVTLENVYFNSYTNVALNVTWPAPVTYVSHTAPAGTTFIDTNSDGRPDRWLLPTFASQEITQLQIQVRGTAIPVGATVANIVTLSAFTGIDTQAGNNVDTVSYTILPSPSITLAKLASTATTRPGEIVTYTVTSTNIAAAVATQVVAQTAVDPQLQFGLNSFGAAVPFQFVDGSPASGLTLGPPQYSSDGGVTWTYVPVSGGGGAPAGFDGNVTHWRIPMTGTMQINGATFQIRYAARVR